MTTLDKPREQALDILCRSEGGAFADPLLDRARQQFDPRDNAFLLELVYGVLRQRSRLDWVLEQFSAQPLSRTDIRTRNILRLGAYQMLFLDRVPASAAVNTSVELAKEHGRKAGYVNGLLRNLDRGRSRIKDPDHGDIARRLAVLHSHPAWLVRRWIERYGAARTEAVLAHNNHPAPLVVRTNTLRTTREALKTALGSAGASVRETVYSPFGLVIESSPGLLDLDPFRRGLFMMQDESAQLIAPLLGPRPGETVLDACAAPGGKTTHLAELMQNKGTVFALENDPGRMSRIGENSGRLGTSIVKQVLGDAAGYAEGAFDRILVDAPCSGLGVLRRHPDGRWIKTERTIRERAGVQRAILKNCAGLLKPGGALVYATCTTEPEENENVISWFLSNSPAAFIVDDPRPFLPEKAAPLVDDGLFFRTFPGEPGMDGFFAVRLIRT